MKKNNSIYLNDILQCIEKIEKYIEGLTENDFLVDEKSADAVTRNYEVMGEAVKRLDPDFRKLHSRIEWKKIAGLRDILIHNYFEVDLKKLWEACHNDLPVRKKKISALVHGQ